MSKNNDLEQILLQELVLQPILEFIVDKFAEELLKEDEEIKEQENAPKSRDIVYANSESAGKNSSSEASKTPCVGSYPVSGYTRADGTEVSAYTRTCGAKHLKKEKENKEKKNVTGGASEVKPSLNNTLTIGKIKSSVQDEKLNKMTILDKMQQVIYESLLKPLFPMSSNATINGMHNFKIVKKERDVTLLNNLNSIGNAKYISILKSMGANDNDKGIIYNEHSNVAQNFKNSSELESHITNIRQAVLENEQLHDIKIKFESSKNDIMSKNERIDRHAFIHNAMLVDQFVDSNGIYTCTLLDYSDFKKVPINSLLDIPNNWGYDMQEKKLYQNYYIIIKIRKKVNW